MQRFVLLLILMFTIVGCRTSNVQPPTSETIPTPSGTPLHPPPSIQTQTNAPTETPFPPPPNPILVSFGVGAGDGVDEIASCLLAYHTYRFALYQDGYLIVFDGNRYLETTISQTEIDKLLNEIDTAGFLSVNEDDSQYILNTPALANTGGLSYFISVKEKTVGVPYVKSENVITSIDKTRKIIENFHPSNLRIYEPERVEIWAVLTQDISLGIASPTPEPSPLHWSSDKIQLDALTGRFHVLTGTPMSFVLEQVKAIPSFRIVQQNEKEYLVAVCPDF
jgi:hypothetical protein